MKTEAQIPAIQPDLHALKSTPHRDATAGFDGGNGGGHDGAMEARVAKLEAHAEKTVESLHAIDLRLTKIDARLEDGFKNFVSKADMTRVEARLDEGFKNFATKSDLATLNADIHKEFSAQTWRIIAIIVVGQMLPAIPGFLRALHLLN